MKTQSPSCCISGCNLLEQLIREKSALLKVFFHFALLSRDTQPWTHLLGRQTSPGRGPCLPFELRHIPKAMRKCQRRHMWCKISLSLFLLVFITNVYLSAEFGFLSLFLFLLLSLPIHRDPYQILTMNHYPPMPLSAEDLKNLSCFKSIKE